MAEVFDQLVKSLSSAEKQDLLKRLESVKPESRPRLETDEEKEIFNWKKAYLKLGFFKKILLWFRKVLEGRELENLVVDMALEDLEGQVQVFMPGLINLKTKIAMKGFYDELKRLADSVAPFRPTFGQPFGETKSDLIAFLVGMEWSGIQDTLLREADFQKAAADNPELTLKELKSLVEGNCRVVLDAIDSNQRHTLFNGLKAFLAFRNLCIIPEESYLGPFQIVSTGDEVNNASLNDLRLGLIKICQAISDIKEPPPLSFIEGAFLYNLTDSKILEDENTWDGSVTEVAESMKTAWVRICDFTNTVPLVKLCALLEHNLDWQPETLVGVEDWFPLYKKFWHQRVEKAYEKFSKERMNQQLLIDACNFLEISMDTYKANLPYPVYYPGLLTPKGNYVLAYLKFFMEKLFQPKMIPLLKIILLEGDFYKKNNRASFTDALNLLLKLSERLTEFNKNFSSTGEWGSQIAALKAIENPDNGFAYKKINEVFLSASDWYDELMSQYSPVFAEFYDILYGIFKGIPGGKYDSINNLNSLGGKSNGVFRRELETLLNRWENFLQHLKDLSSVNSL